MSRHAEAKTAFAEAMRLLGVTWTVADVRALVTVAGQRESHAKRQRQDVHTPQNERKEFENKEIFWRKQKITLETIAHLLSV